MIGYLSQHWMMSDESGNVNPGARIPAAAHGSGRKEDNRTISRAHQVCKRPLMVKRSRETTSAHIETRVDILRDETPNEVKTLRQVMTALIEAAAVDGPTILITVPQR